MRRVSKFLVLAYLFVDGGEAFVLEFFLYGGCLVMVAPWIFVLWWSFFSMEACGAWRC